MKLTKDGVTAAKGFWAASTAAGIKYTGRDDMALIVSSVPCKAAGVFTKNVVKAAPVVYDQNVVAKGQATAIVVNSGIANACTGVNGLMACEATAEKAGAALGIDPGQVLVASTGVIGMPLNMDKVKAGIDQLVKDLADEKENNGAESLEGGHKAAKAIMTTDTHPKEVAVEFEVGGKKAVLGGMCKGSGMIHPNLGTMLCFLTTDVSIDQKLLQEALLDNVQETFNMVSVDRDTSTNDSVLLLANGQAGNPTITEKNEDYKTFSEALHQAALTLCKMIAGDGEGANALLQMDVVGAKTHQQAKVIAKSVITSNLVKTAIAGHDANWGRIICAMGYSGEDFDPALVDLFFESKAGKIQILKNGTALAYSEEEATRILSETEITCKADLHLGSEKATAWGCDLTKQYVSINADYRS